MIDLHNDLWALNNLCSYKRLDIFEDPQVSVKTAKLQKLTKYQGKKLLFVSCPLPPVQNPCLHK